MEPAQGAAGRLRRSRRLRALGLEPAPESPREEPPAPALGPEDGHTGAPGEPGRGETLGVAPAPAPQRRNPAKKGKEAPAIPKGRPKSGRVWKDPGKRRFSHMIQDKPLHTSWERKMKERQEKKIVQDFARYLKEEKQREREAKKKRREENLKRRLENERKAEIVQVIRNPLKLKRTKKKQLRRIEKRDTLALLQKHQAQRKGAKEFQAQHPSAMIQLRVTPETSLADTSVRIRVSGLAPTQLVTLQALLTDDRGVKFQARAFYRADEAGEVDLEQAAATGGDYVGVWPMGLFWFLKPEKLFHRLLKRDVMSSPFRFQLDLFDSFQFLPPPQVVPLATCSVERWYVGPGVERVPIKEGRIRGALFLPPGPGPFPGVIDMFGGAGGLIEFRASLLASQGFAALALAFFAYDDLPQVLVEVDLEYFEEAANLLLKHPKVKGPGLGVMGVSKGAEVTLAMATFLEKVVATVWINGTGFMNDTPLRYKDVYIPAIPYCPERLRITELGVLDNYHVFQDPQDPAYATAAIPVEKAQGEVLFVVGEADRNFNSKLFAEMAIGRMKSHGKNNYTLLSYPGAGHLIEPPGSPLCSISLNRGSPRPVHWGGEPEPHAKAQEHSWQEILKFLDRCLGPTSHL